MAANKASLIADPGFYCPEVVPRAGLLLSSLYSGGLVLLCSSFVRTVARVKGDWSTFDTERRLMTADWVYIGLSGGNLRLKSAQMGL